MPKPLQYAKPAAELPPDLLDHPDRLVRPGQLAALEGIAVATIYSRIKRGELPPTRRLSHRVAGWRVRELLPFLRPSGAAA